MQICGSTTYLHCIVWPAEVAKAGCKKNAEKNIGKKNSMIKWFLKKNIVYKYFWLRIILRLNSPKVVVRLKSNSELISIGQSS